MAIKSKDATLLVISLILLAILAIVFQYKLVLNEMNLLFMRVVLLTVVVISITWIFYMRLREAEKDIINQSLFQERVNEKLKIHEQLIDIKADIQELQKKVFKK